MEIFYTPHFIKAFKKLDVQTKLEYVEREKLFKENPFNPVLKTHKLHGSKGILWAYSLNYSLRVIFEFGPDRELWCNDIGDHDIYD